MNYHKIIILHLFILACLTFLAITDQAEEVVISASTAKLIEKGSLPF